MKTLLIVVSCFFVSACHGQTARSVSAVLQEAEGGFRGLVEVVGTYDFHSEEDTLWNGSDGPMLQLILVPLLKDVPIEVRYEARKKFGEKFHGQRVVVSGVLKKGRIEGWSREVVYVAVSKIEKMRR